MAIVRYMGRVLEVPDIDLRGVSGDIRFECPVCHWGVTLKPGGAELWTDYGQIVPRCRKDDIALTRTVLP
jgi:hypothetical protein